MFKHNLIKWGSKQSIFQSAIIEHMNILICTELKWKCTTENSILLICQIGAKCKEIAIQIFNEYNIQIFMIKKQYTIKTRLEMREEMSCFKIRILYNFATRKEKYLPQAKFFSSILFIDSYRSRYFKQKLIIGLIRSFRLCTTMCTYFVKTKI